MAGKIFINYRHNESVREASHLFTQLSRQFSEQRLFIDRRGLDGGAAWGPELERQVATAFCMLSLIGKEWPNASNEHGQPRIRDEGDYVRLEIAEALRRGIPIIPVLIDGAPMPRADQLPPSLMAFVLRQGLPLRTESFSEDSARIAEAIKKLGAERRIKPRHLMVGIATSLVSGMMLGVFGTNVVNAPTDRPIAAFQLNDQLKRSEAAVRASREALQAAEVKVSTLAQQKNDLEARLTQSLRVSSGEYSELGSRLVSAQAELGKAQEQVKELSIRKSALENQLEQVRRAGVERLREHERRVAALEADLQKAQAAEKAAVDARSRQLAGSMRDQAETPQELTKALQSKLHALGYYTGAMDGVVGAKLESAIRSAFIGQGDAAGSLGEQADKFKRLYSEYRRDAESNQGAYVSFVRSLISTKIQKNDISGMRQSGPELDVVYIDGEVRHTGSFPIDGEHAEIILHLKGPSFDRLRILDNDLNVQMVEICRKICSEAGAAEKKSINRDDDVWRRSGSTFSFVLENFAQVKSYQASSGSAVARPDFDDKLHLRLTQVRGMAKSYSLTFVYRRRDDVR